MTMLLLAFSQSGWSKQQEREIRGTVKDESGAPLEGVSVNALDTEIGTKTTADGRYALSIPEGVKSLKFSLLGYDSLVMPIGSSPTIDATLTQVVSDLEEVVVVGYGTAKRSDITGAVSSVNVADLENIPLRSMDQALQGRTSGVFITQGGGQPGASNSIRIRGGNSITGSNEPLYVIDGIPVYVAPTDGTAQALNPLNSISPSDIESIEVLKDASATAIYGARGGNGVVIITTKRGKTGESNVDVDISIGLQNELKRYDLLNAAQFRALANEASVNDGGPLLYDPDEAFSNTDWQSYLYRSQAPVQNYNIAATGGDEKTQYMASFNYFDQQGILKASDMERYAMRLNLDRTINDWLKFGNNLTASYVLSNRIPTTAVSTAPDLPVYQEDGSYTMFQHNGTGFNNPVGLINDARNLNKVYRTLGNVFADIQLMEGLKFRTMWGVDAIFNKTDTYMPQSVYEGWEVGGNGKISTNQNVIWINENTLDFSRKFGVHQFNVLAGFTQQGSRYESVGASATGFLNDNTQNNNLGLGNPDQALLPESETAEWALMSWLGRINYNLMDKYLITLTGRYDGSSRFGADNRWGFFPSAAVAWKIMEEPFMENVKNISDLRLRASYGITGNQDGLGNYPALDLWGAANYVFSDLIAGGITPTQLMNTHLKWESTASGDVGLELGLFNNRISFAFDAYYKRTRDLLLKVNIPGSSGFTMATKNIGSVENKGLEFTLDVVPVEKEVVWSSSFNISFNRNKVVDLGDDDELIPANGKKSALLKVGEPLGNFYGYVSDGLFQSDEEVAAGAQPAARPGDVRFVDFDGDNVININDRRVLGNAQPSFYGGWTNSVSYKGFDLSVFLQFVYGNEIFNENYLTLENLTGSGNQLTTVLNRWTPDNRNTNIPRATTTKPTEDPYDHYVEDGSYVRLKNVNLSYLIPVGSLGLKGIRMIKAYVSLQNLVTWTNYSGLDPEVNRYGNDNTLQGYDNSPYPNVRTTTFGLAVGF